MATYAIGDVQGCFKALEQLLIKINFNLQKDQLWFTGDLVNRGPQSLEVLRFVKSLGEKQITVLGNHDLHLLAVAYGVREVYPGDTIANILTVSDREELMDWLRSRPLLHDDNKLGFVMTHAGLAPSWSLTKAQNLAREVEIILRGPTPKIFLQEMYGNSPKQWDDQLTGIERLRCIINYFTRMRFCYEDGSLDLNYKGDVAHKPAELIPWFDVETRANAQLKIIFGHWAALGGKVDQPYLYPLDTGCVWGNCLTALCLDDESYYRVSCNQ